MPTYDYRCKTCSHEFELSSRCPRLPNLPKHRQFTKGSLAGSLTQCQITYRWLGKLLGGYRRDGYEEHMTTAAFRKGVHCLEQLATQKPTAIMCSELQFFRCHRRFIADALTAGGQTVLHIMAHGKLHKHKLLEADE